MVAFVLSLGSKGTESESQGYKYSFQAAGPKKGDLNPLIVRRFSLMPSPVFTCFHELPSAEATAGLPGYPGEAQSRETCPE